jgi:phosphatidylglycerophosphatase A
MPGTVASVAVAALLGAVSAWPGVYLAVALGCLLAGCGVTLGFGGSVAGPEGHGDPGWVVSDEVAGQALACLGALPACGDLRVLALALLLFRLLDILKPGPVATLERVPGGAGILLDDLAAGLLAALPTLALALVLATGG